MMKKKINDIIDIEQILINNVDYMFEDLFVGIKNELSLNGIDVTGTEFEKILTDDYISLNVGYFIEHSNKKYISPLFERLLEVQEKNNQQLSWVFGNLVKQISKKYALSWYKIYDALITEYKPLENYSMTEHRDHDNTVSNNTDITTDVDNQNGLHGFNSETSNPTTDNDGSNHVIGDAKDNYQTDIGDEHTTRTGNIGVTTSQQMLESEIKLRQYNFINQIFNDIDKILCLSIY